MNNKNDKNDKKSPWTRLLEHGTLLGIAAVITAIGGIIAILRPGGCQPPEPTATHTPTPTPIDSPTPIVTVTTHPTLTVPPTEPEVSPEPIVSPTVPTHTPPPPPTHTPTPVESPLESFERYGSDEALQADYSIDAPLNDASVSLAGVSYAYDGTQALAFTYDIHAIELSADGTLTDYAGLRIDLPTRDWRGWNYLRLWVRSDASNRSLMIQFHEASGEVWKYTTNLSRFDDEDLQLPLDTSRFQHAEWSPWVNGQIDLGAIVGYSIYVGHGGKGQGTIYIDAIRLSK